jgi:hypothetical protein
MTDLEESIVSQVLEQIHASSSVHCPPVRLSKVVNSFDIEPIPRFDPSVAEGRLHFDQAQNRFVITLGMNGATCWSHDTGELFNGVRAACEDPLLTRRLRFTYAHEVAHRFCFFKEEEQWTRALKAAVLNESSVPVTDRRRLELREEHLCNRVAGRLLVPRNILREFFDHRMSGSTDSSFFDFHQEIKRAADLFDVSQDCLLVQLQKAAERGQVDLPPNLCAFSLRFSDRTGPNLRATRALRIQIALLPSHVGGVRLRRIFPGLAVRHLGPSVTSWITDLAKSDIKTRSGELKVPLVLQTNCDGHSTQDFKFSGWWKSNYRTKQNIPEALLMWGFISCDSSK